jgi:LmbE family N-acetylglucosaminyl deacetylase
MKLLGLAGSNEPLSVLCLGAHSDDIEIGAAATIFGWIERGIRLNVHWAVLSATGQRANEAYASAMDFLADAACATIDLATFKDGFFPYQGAELKCWFEELKSRVAPEVILSHWNTFRDHLILEYEIPKWDGDLGRPNVYIPASKTAMARKVGLLLDRFGSQRAKDWFDPQIFTGLARLRGGECRAPEGFAEAFHVRKLALQ